MRKPLVAGNWKLNGSRQSIKHLLEGLLSGLSSVKSAEVAVCAPAIYLPYVAELLKNTNLNYGSQNICEFDEGAYTGEISGPMLKEFSCKYAIVGHSERRALYKETDQEVARKVVAAQRSNLIPILCVGELLEQREANETEKVVARQIDAVLDETGIDAFSNIVIAYEPVWAIGTGKTASPQQAQEVHAFIRNRIGQKNAQIAEKVQILYGGSVKADNAVELFGQTDIDGGLIGGASLQADSFLAICQAAK